MSNSWVDKFNKYFEDIFKNKNITRFESGDGFSLVDEYSKKFKKQMGVGSDGNQVPFFKFYFNKEKTINDEEYVPLVITAAITTAVKEGDNKRYMLNDSTIKRFKPIEITSIDDFYIATKNGKLYEKHEEKFSLVNLVDVYNRMYKVHVSDVLTIRGIITRVKFFTLRRAPSLLFEFFVWLFGWAIWGLKGKRYSYDVISERYLNKRADKKEEVAAKDPNRDIDFFGYKVSVWTLYSYSIVIILVNISARSFFDYLLQRNDLTSGIATIALAIITIVSYDKIIPTILRSFVKYSANVAFDLKYKGIK